MIEDQLNARNTELVKYKANLDIQVAQNGGKYTPELFYTHITIPIGESPIFKQCVHYEPTKYVGMNMFREIYIPISIETCISPRIRDYLRAGFSIEQLLRVKLSYKNSNLISQNYIVENMLKESFIDTLTDTIRHNTHIELINIFKADGFTASTLKDMGFLLQKD